MWGYTKLTGRIIIERREKEIMEFQMGNKIIQLREAKGLTQKQLAEQLGISAPAVSKWETNTSYPDITLLTPLARALGTNLDTLLSYEEDLTQEQMTAFAQEIILLKTQKGIQAAEEKLQEILHRYPNSIGFKFQAVGLFTYLSMPEGQGNMSSSECAETEQTERDKTDKSWVNHKYDSQKEKLLREVYESKDPTYLQSAVAALAAMALGEEDFDAAEQWLNELPKQPEDATSLWVLLYEQRGEKEEAEKLLQNRLYQTLSQARSYMVMRLERMVKQMTPPESELRTLCKICEELDQMVFAQPWYNNLLFAEVYGKMGQEDRAADYLKQYLQHYPSNLQPNPILFPALAQGKDPINQAGENAHNGSGYSFVRNMMLQSIRQDEVLGELCEREDIKELMESAHGIS